MHVGKRHDYIEMIHSVVVPGNLTEQEKRDKYTPVYEFLNSNIPDKLFRFRSCKERTIYEFDQDIISFSPASEMNDDFDGMLYFDKKRIVETLRKTLSFDKRADSVLKDAVIKTATELSSEKNEKALQYLLDNFRNISVEEINSLKEQLIDLVTDNYEKRVDAISRITQFLKVACFSADIQSPAMWGYYANNGTGFALSYDFRRDNNPGFCIYPVIYGEKRLDATDFATWLMQHQTIQRILSNSNSLHLYSWIRNIIYCPDEFMSTKVLLQKADNWSHEKEWRMIYPESGRQDVKYPYTKNKATAIYLGRNISSIHEKILRYIASEKGIPVYKMTISQEDAIYKFRPICI